MESTSTKAIIKTKQSEASPSQIRWLLVCFECGAVGNFRFRKDIESVKKRTVIDRAKMKENFFSFSQSLSVLLALFCFLRLILENYREKNSPLHMAAPPGVSPLEARLAFWRVIPGMNDGILRYPPLDTDFLGIDLPE